ncbi:membrane protein insertase YidC [Campylobacter sp. faydin G-140]|uniref:membrane protein insertase YidC n=1 Tax=Campylobacter anatolicus TaxID=2829105 RepID=UPI001BA07549|nr:membrane protein insertase YidC [Campylobacter anatolicus]MBR8466052.1 membrane protein insertase YidC [Campylobacter anatolicus]
MDKLSTQKRVLLATLLSIIFFIVYDYFLIPKNALIEQNQTTQIQQPIAQNNAAPVANASLTPVTTSNAREQIIATIKAKKYEILIDNLGRISKFYLNEAKYKTEDGSRIELTNSSPLPLEMRFSDTIINEQAFNTSYTADVSEIEVKDGESKTINLTQKLQNLTVNKKLTFYPDGNYDIDVVLDRQTQYFISPGLRPNVVVDNYTIHGALLRHTDESLTILEDDDLEGSEKFDNITIAADSDRYYTTLFYSFDKPMSVVMSTDAKNNAVVFVSENGKFKASGYIGAKEHRVLDSIDKRLNDVIEYGWFTFIAKPMFAFLNFLHSYIGNWGWAIVMLTLVIRLVLFPLTYKGMLSMNKLKDLAPKVKELQAKYKGDPQKLNASMMELYKKNGANPMGGCLPILLQIPVFFAIYRVLLNAIELKGAEWILWIHDLSIMDPYFILPILMGVTMFLQQRLTPTTFTDPMQEKIMKYLPLIFTFFFVTFPAGLTLYWFVNNVCSVIQQIFVNKLFEKHRKAKAEVKV